MPNNNGKGGRNKRRGKRSAVSSTSESGAAKQLEVRGEGEDYGNVQKMLGDCRMQVICTDGITRIGKIPGKFRKRVYVNMSDIVLVSMRGYEQHDKNCDIIMKYSAQEVRQLVKVGQITQAFQNIGSDDAEGSVQGTFNTRANDDCIDFVVDDGPNIDINDL